MPDVTILTSKYSKHFIFIIYLLQEYSKPSILLLLTVFLNCQNYKELLLHANVMLRLKLTSTCCTSFLVLKIIKAYQIIQSLQLCICYKMQENLFK